MSHDGQEEFSKTGNAVPSLISMAEDREAEWRVFPYPYYNHSAFVSFPEADVVEYTYDALDSVQEPDVRGIVMTLFQTVTEGLHHNQTIAEFAEAQAESVRIRLGD
jgi:hypothetical protein